MFCKYFPNNVLFVLHVLLLTEGLSDACILVYGVKMPQAKDYFWYFCQDFALTLMGVLK